MAWNTKELYEKQHPEKVFPVGTKVSFKNPGDQLKYGGYAPYDSIMGVVERLCVGKLDCRIVLWPSDALPRHVATSDLIAVPPEVVLPFKVGDKVKIKKGLKLIQYGARLSRHVGTVERIYDEVSVTVQFPEFFNTNIYANSDLKLAPVKLARPKPTFKVGDLVKVKKSVKQPAYNWGEVKPGDLGIISKVGPTVSVDFPNQANWSSLPSELELIPLDPNRGIIQSGNLTIGIGTGKLAGLKHDHICFLLDGKQVGYINHTKPTGNPLDLREAILIG